MNTIERMKKEAGVARDYRSAIGSTIGAEKKFARAVRALERLAADLRAERREEREARQ